MKILCCVRDDIKGNIALNRFLKSMGHHEISVILSRKISHSERTIERLVTYEFLECYLMDHYFNLFDNGSGGSRTISSSDDTLLTFNQLAVQYNITIERRESPNDESYIEFVRDFAPDLILSCRYDYIFKKPILEIPKIGILNIHPGALPDYQGLLAPFYALSEGVPELGVTVHWIDEGVDTGNVIEIDYLPADPGIAVFDYYIDLYKKGMDLLIKIIEDIERGDIPAGTPQTEGTYHSFPSEDTFRSFEDRGLRLFDYDSYLERLSLYEG